jgi:hypothetical protein
MELGHNQFQGADPFCGVYVHGDTTAIVLYPDNVVPFQDNQNRVAVALHGLVYGVVYHLVYKVMKAVYTGCSDIHTRPFTYSFQTFKNLDVLSRVV